MVLERTYISFVAIATLGLPVIAGALLILNFAIPKENRWIMLPLAVLYFVILPPVLYGLGYVYVKGHRYIITNERIIMFRKFIGILLRTVTHDKITDLIVNQGPIGRICNYGRVSPITAGMIMPMGAYSEITDLILNQGPIARILNYGSITPLSPRYRRILCRSISLHEACRLFESRA